MLKDGHARKQAQWHAGTHALNTPTRAPTHTNTHERAHRHTYARVCSHNGKTPPVCEWMVVWEETSGIILPSKKGWLIFDYNLHWLVKTSLLSVEYFDRFQLFMSTTFTGMKAQMGAGYSAKGTGYSVKGTGHNVKSYKRTSIQAVTVIWFPIHTKKKETRNFQHKCSTCGSLRHKKSLFPLTYTDTPRHKRFYDIRQKYVKQWSGARIGDVRRF